MSTAPAGRAPKASSTDDDDDDGDDDDERLDTPSGLLAAKLGDASISEARIEADADSTTDSASAAESLHGQLPPFRPRTGEGGRRLNFEGAPATRCHTVFCPLGTKETVFFREAPDLLSRLGPNADLAVVEFEDVCEKEEELRAAMAMMRTAWQRERWVWELFPNISENGNNSRHPPSAQAGTAGAGDEITAAADGLSAAAGRVARHVQRW
jgi:hypothetical protein